MTQETYTLNDGHSVPKIGLGTFQIRGYEVRTDTNCHSSGLPVIRHLH